MGLLLEKRQHVCGFCIRSRRRRWPAEDAEASLQFILLWVVSSSSSCSIDFSQRINYQRQSQASLKWAEGEMMFSFPGSLLAFVQAFSGAQGSGPCQGRAVRSTIHLLCGCLDWLRICRQVLLQSSAYVCRRSLQCQGARGG